MVVLSAAALCVNVMLSGAAFAQQESKADKKASKKEKQEVHELVKLVDEAMTGGTVPSDFSIGWSDNFMKATENKTYVPFSLTIDASKLMVNPSMAMYLRVVPKTAPATATDAKKEKKKKDDYPFEDVHFFDIQPPAAGQPFDLDRAFAVPAGDYDVYIALQQVAVKGSKAPQMTSVLKESVSVPDFWNGELTTSSLILTKAIERLQAPLSADDQADHPYVIGNAQIIPSTTSKLAKSGQLSLVFMIYNTGLDASTKKPDVTVDYEFYQKTAAGEKFFNKTNPQVFNASTLPPQFNPAAGHQIVAGQTVPLATFPVGDYRLAITVTDKTSGKTLKRDVLFSVVS
ncbi:MAG TPA: hypothetical protein VNE16_06140 [Vicinamibacterales bacterium]|nr:hypothetical protein [Vicinamibacterales bacterium]